MQYLLAQAYTSLSIARVVSSAAWPLRRQQTSRTLVRHFARPRLRGVQEHVDDHDGVHRAAGAQRPRVPISCRVTQVRWQLCGR